MTEMAPNDDQTPGSRTARLRDAEFEVEARVRAHFLMGGSARHLRDIRQMLTISADQVDVRFIEQWSRALGVATEWREAERFDADA